MTADILTSDGIVAWFQGGSEYGPRALAYRILLADPRRPGNLERLNRIRVASSSGRLRRW